MKTLVIHPEDASTDFLKPIYEQLFDFTLITKNVSQSEIIDLIVSHEQILMLGHGSSEGLFGIQFGRDFVINKDVVKVLKQKKSCYFIWCHADEFVIKHNLKGLYSGMFISELIEAMYYGFESLDFDDLDKMINESNIHFSRILGQQISANNRLDVVYNNLKTEYKMPTGENPIVNYNCDRLKFKS